MIEIGRLCIKTAGRDAGKHAVIIDILDNNYVLIDGETRRRKCNILHLEPLKDVIKINKNASHEDVKKEFGKLGLKVKETTPKPKTERPRKLRGKEKIKEEKIEKKDKKVKKKKVKEEKVEKKEKKAKKEKVKEEKIEKKGTKKEEKVVEDKSPKSE